MKLYLVQHGEAASKDVDPERPLTEKGREDSANTARFLKSAGITVNAIWHSGKTRTMETAEIFEKELPPQEGILQKDGLAPMDPPAAILDAAGSVSKDMMIVGHLPLLQKLASLALIREEEPGIVRFSMGGVVCLERNEEGAWQLFFEIIPELL